MPNQPKAHLTKFWTTLTIKRNGDVLESTHRYSIYRPSASISVNFVYVRSLVSTQHNWQVLCQNLWVTLYRVTHKFCHNFPPLLFANQWTHSDEILICCSWGFIDNISLSLFGLVKHFYKSELQKKILTHDVARNFFQKFPDAQFLIPANIQRKILIRRWSRRRIW